MNRDDIIRWARSVWSSGDVYIGPSYDSLHEFATRAYADGRMEERERACRIVTGLCISDNNAREINDAIWSRGKQ